MSRSRLAGAALVLLAAASLTSCVQVPDRGPVVEAKPRGRDDGAQQEPYSNPPPPKPGATPKEIVLGFLEAMTATPLRTAPASAFLTQQGQASWKPVRVLIYGRHAAPTGHQQVALRLRGADRIGAGGQWEGPVPTRGARLTFTMAQENGQWRIASAPNALILQRAFYQQHYQDDASLYYFDPTGRILVPEPVHVPQEPKLASSLVTALLRGPRSGRGDVARTFIPSGLSVDLSVAVDRSLAQVSLKGADPGPLSETTTRLMLAQLAWTLRQDSSITAFTLTIAGRTITDAAGATRIPVDDKTFNAYDPAVATASGQTYALRRGRLVSGPVNDLTKVDGPFGDARSAIGAFAVNLDSTRVAGVTSDSLQVGTTTLGSTEPTTLLTGPGLLRPAWDFADRLWEVQDRQNRATVTYIAQGLPHRVRVPGITGQNVHRFLVSRDGSRFVAVLRGPSADQIVASRIRYDAEGRAIGATRAQPIGWSAGGTSRIRDIGWTTPTTIAVLDQVAPATAEVRILNVDGSTRPDQAPPTQVSGRVRALAVAPGQTPYAVLQSALTNISPDQVQTRQIPIVGLHHLTYAG